MSRPTQPRQGAGGALISPAEPPRQHLYPYILPTALTSTSPDVWSGPLPGHFHSAFPVGKPRNVAELQRIHVSVYFFFYVSDIIRNFRLKKTLPNITSVYLHLPPYKLLLHFVSKKKREKKAVFKIKINWKLKLRLVSQFTPGLHYSQSTIHYKISSTEPV